MTSLTEDNITFGKYKGKVLNDMLKDRDYCKWLLHQEFFQNYEYLHNKVKEYNPLKFFLPEKTPSTFDSPKDFIRNFTWFNLTPLEDLKIQLSDNYKKCYSFYIKQIQELKNKLILNLESENPYNIKSPSRFLQKFEKDSGLNRKIYKTFLYEYELLNILKILEHIKNTGGIEYKGNKGWEIAKKRSENQEQWWLLRLKDAFGEHISSQFKFHNCIFDFIHIKKNILFEAKLNLKDFDVKQYNKYLKTINHYDMVYLIKTNTIIHISNKIIYTTEDPDIWRLQQTMEQNKTTFHNLIRDFDVIKITDIVSTISKL